MSITVTSKNQIPAAKCYVLANDPFFSNWGQSEGRTNTVIVPCESWAEAQFVEGKLKDQGLERVRSTMIKPVLRSAVLYSLCTYAETPRWYEAEITLRRDSEDYYRVKFDEGLRNHPYNGIESTAEYTFWEAFNKAVSVAQKCGVRHLEINWMLNENRQQEADAARGKRMRELESALEAVLDFADSVTAGYNPELDAARKLLNQRS